MGCRGTHNTPFLVLRPNVGQFTYQRSVPENVAPYVVGSIELGWCDRQRKLDGKATIKISLGTGDAKLAHARWADVHPQVDALVQLAALQAKARAGAGKAEAVVTPLTPERIRIMAAQAYHDRLAEDDRTHIDPTFTPALASVILQICGPNSEFAGPHGRDRADRGTQGRERWPSTD